MFFCLYKILIITAIISLNCAFELPDLVFKNIKLIEDPLDKENRVPDLKKSYKKKKSEKLYETPKIPSINSEKIIQKTPVKNFVKDVLFEKQDFFLFGDDFINAWFTTEKGVQHMFQLDALGFKYSNKDYGKTAKSLKEETSKLPILNDIPGVKLYKKDDWIPQKIDDLQAVGIDDVLPNSVGVPLKPKDYDPQPYFDFFQDFITPEKQLNTNVLDSLP